MTAKEKPQCQRRKAAARTSFYDRVILLAETTLRHSKSDEERAEALQVKAMLKKAA